VTPEEGQFCAWRDEDGDLVCTNIAIVGWGPNSTPLCFKHFDAALRMTRRTIDDFLARLTYSDEEEAE
jgi:hypothetical protein